MLHGTLLSSLRPVERLRDGLLRREEDRLAVEEPLEIRLCHEGGEATSLAVTMRTPGHDEDLAAGFCLTEGVIESAAQIDRITPCAAALHGNIVTVTLEAGTSPAQGHCTTTAQREFYMSSSCGLCGKQTIDRIYQKLKPIGGNFSVSQTVLARLPAMMREAQPTFEQTGGLHAAALFSPAGQMLVLREDVGRHNAVDKAIGWMLMHDHVPIDPAILLISGRGSFEIMQKAAVAGIALVAAVGAPSTLAADFAQKTGQTLIGFLREDRMNVYCHAKRVT